jgi:hypothetical protein
MLGGFFCVSSKKKRKTSNGKTKKAKRGKRLTPKRGKKVQNKLTKTSRKSKRGKRKQTGGETISHDLNDSLGRGSYPVTHRGHTDCSGIHHK